MQSVVPEETTNYSDNEERLKEVAWGVGGVPSLTLVEINYSGNKDSHPSRVIARHQVADRLQVRRAITSAFDNYSQLPRVYRKYVNLGTLPIEPGILLTAPRELCFFS